MHVIGALLIAIMGVLLAYKFENPGVGGLGLVGTFTWLAVFSNWMRKTSAPEVCA